MIFKVSLYAALLACIGTATSNQHMTDFKLYAYGSGLKPGLRLFYGDGLAYIGEKTPSFVTEAVNVTFSESVDGTEFVAKPDTSTAWDQELLYVVNSTDAFDSVGFATDGDNGTSSNTTSGFGLYGGWAFHQNGDGKIQMKFYATPTDDEDIYLVKWSAGGTQTSGDTPIALRTMAPTVITI
ncbi:hypothetical protein K491DRAFT_687202 [Lophiostoma macrostomum CBS 122681]|uniref:Uncharacterized protein n=1 Tax=Lophiostoma macrostomum CBS 122681 TaxID=1314788 RepID=A0A6A6TQU8_9PLEO|nr:hypothetical protein K491DRAFT_687202 [Lophiostoma macrostomum CBS 122681]